MAAVVLAMMGALGLGIVFTMLLPGFGLVGVLVVVVLGAGSLAWLLMDAANGRTPTRRPSETER